MNALTASLCKQPIIGVGMWLMTLCVTNQALHERYLDLSLSGTVLNQAFDAPMDETYSLSLVLRPEAGAQASGASDWRSLLCVAGSNQPLRLRLLISGAAGTAPQAHDFEATCASARQPKRQTLRLGTVHLQAGRQHIELFNSHPLGAPAGTRIQALLTGEGAGFP